MLTFDEATHTYTLDGIRLPSVTEVTRFCAYDYRSDRPWLAEAAARRGTAVHEACALIGSCLLTFVHVIGGDPGDRRIPESLPPVSQRLETGMETD